MVEKKEERMVRTGLKVCRDIGNKNVYESALNLGRTQKYYMDEWAKRHHNCGPFAVFNTL